MQAFFTPHNQFLMNKNLFFSTFAILSLTACSSCFPTGSDDCEKHYEFTIPITVYPVRDTFHLGDTIWVESTVQNIISNNLDGVETDISNLELKLDASITEYNQNGYISARHLFNYIDEFGSFKPYGSFFIRMGYQENNSQNRRFKVGIIPIGIGTGQGTFSLAFDYLRTDYEKYEVLNKKCLDNIVFGFETNEGRDSSSYLLLPNTFTQAVTQVQFNKSGSFAFRIIE